jgi:hypothetical protein
LPCVASLRNKGGNDDDSIEMSIAMGWCWVPLRHPKNLHASAFLLQKKNLKTRNEEGAEIFGPIFAGILPESTHAILT